ncbi:MAG: GNAT family N-acetyltransferase, partial [Bacteroidota bacterium]
MKFWFQTGTQDENNDRNNNGVIDSIDDTMDLITELTRKGYRPFHDIQYLEIKDGRHNQETWAQAMPHFLHVGFWNPMADSKIILRTSRLVLREFIAADAADIFRLNSDPEVIQFTGDEAFKSVKEAAELIQNYDQYKKNGYGRWTVLLEDSSEYIGWCGLNFNKDSKETDLGFRFLRNHWGKGFATEAAAACLHYGFSQRALNKIIGRAMKENRASIKVLEKIGMQFEKEFEAHGGMCIQLCKIR